MANALGGSQILLTNHSGIAAREEARTMGAGFLQRLTCSRVHRDHGPVLSRHPLANVKIPVIQTVTKMTTGRTGETCSESGVYYCSTHPDNTIPLSKGEKFPPCSRGAGHGATWILKYKA